MSEKAVIEQVGKRIDDFKEHVESMLMSFSEQVKEQNRNAIKYFESVQKLQSDRQDSHGAQMREGFAKILKKQEEDSEKHEKDFSELNIKIDGIDKRTSALETERNVFSKMLALFGITGGVAGWGPHIKAWFQSLGKS